jgi:hypothetical protein
MFSRGLKIITMWGPLIGVAAWGGFHLVDCAQTLFSPGTGIALEYPTPGGNLRIRCQTYSFDPLSGSLIAQDVELRQPDGKLIARVPRIQVRGLYFDGTIAPSTSIQDGTFWVRRERDGKFDIAKYLKSEEKEASDLAFSVDLRDCRVNLLDETVPGVSNDLVTIDRAHLVGQGETVKGSAKIALNGWLTGRFDFARFADHVHVEGKGVNLLPAPLLARLRSGAEAKTLRVIDPLKIASGKLTGDILVDYRHEARWQVATKGDLGGFAWGKYAVDKVVGQVTVNQTGFVGNLTGEHKGVRAKFDGSGRYDKGFRMAGDAEVEGATEAVLNEYGVPKQRVATFQSASGKGWLSIADQQVSFRGDVSAKQVKAFKLSTPLLAGTINLQGDELSGFWKPVTIGKSTISGSFSYQGKQNAWSVYAESSNARSVDFAPYSPNQLGGTTGQVQLVANGRGSKIEAHAVGLLDPKIQLGDTRLSYQDAEFALAYDGKRVQVERFYVEDRGGSLLASGTIDFKQGLNVRVQASGLDLNTLYADAKGQADLRGMITGSVSNPQYIGDFNGYEVGYGELPGRLSAVAGQARINQKGLEVRNLIAVRGAAQLGGGLTFGFNKQNLAGTVAVTGVDVQELYKGPINGLLDFENIKISGTAAKPVVTADITSKSILAQDFKLEDVKGSFLYEGGQVQISEGRGKVAGGTLDQVQLDFDPKRKGGQLRGNFTALKVDELTERLQASTLMSSDPTAVLGRDLSLLGSVGGAFTVDIARGEIAKVASTGRLDDIRLNGRPFGSGDWSVGLKDNVWSFDGMLGSLEDYIRIDAATYNTKNRRIGGEFITYKLPLNDLILAVEPQFRNRPEAFEKLKLFDGKVGVLAQISGDMDKPVIEVPDLQVSNLKLGGEELGTLKLKATYTNKELPLLQGSLVGPKISKIAVPFAGTIQLPDKFAPPDGSVNLDGKMLNDGQLLFNASIFGFPVSKFAPVAPALEKMDAYVNRADLKLTGTKEQPELIAGITGSIGFDQAREKGAPSFLRNRLKVEGQLTGKPRGVDFIDLGLNASLNFNGLTGFARGNLSLDSAYAIAKQQPLNLSAGLDKKHSLEPFLKDLDGVDFGAGATIDGAITVSNTAENPQVTGGLQVAAPQVKYTKSSPITGGPLSTWLQNLEVNLGLANDPKLGYLVQTTGRATTNHSDKTATRAENGYVTWTAGIPVNDYIKLEPSSTPFLNRELVNSRISINRFALAQTFPENTYASLTAYTEKPVAITGTLGKPRISGEIVLDQVKTAVPTIEVAPGEGQKPLIDPYFDLTFRVVNLAEIKAGTADLRVNGQGSMKGPLSDLEAGGVLKVDKGSINLPGGKVKLEPEGTLNLTYKASALENKTQMIANLKGETSLTVLRGGVTPERYDIGIEVKGDLLESKANTLTFTNKPAELSDERVLQLLGRADLLLNAFQQGLNGSVETELRDTLTSIALPNLLGGVTNNIAKNFGFDYVSIDYNPFELASVNFAKSLDRGFFLQGRRQLLAPLPGQQLAYDFRLAYRPRRGPEALRGLSFSVGIDQVRPYKLSIDFTQRVRTQKPAYRSVTLGVPNK